MVKLEMIKELETMVALQADCLQKGDWDTFDKVEDTVKKLERLILESSMLGA